VVYDSISAGWYSSQTDAAEADRSRPMLHASGIIPSFSMTKLKSVCPIKLHMKPTASNWIPSKQTMSLLQSGSQTAQAYSRCGKQRVLHASKQVCCGTECSAYLIIPSWLFTFRTFS